MYSPSILWTQSIQKKTNGKKETLDNSQGLLLYCDKNEVKMEEYLSDNEIYDRIKNKLVIIYNKSDNEKYNNIISSIKELVKNFNC